MPSGNGQSLAINWLSRKTLGSWFANQNQAVAATAVWACSVKYAMLTAEGKITVWNTPDASSILSTLLSMKSRLRTPLK